MKTLILAVDRDDDIGVKTGIKGPIIGREDNLAAALKLALADSEDADVNTLFSAVALYDELTKGGAAAEVATITGDAKVGPYSDRLLTLQLDEVLEEVKPHHAYLVSDGAEDEYIYPIIASRIRVDHVRRVLVKQHAGLESTYYVLAHAFKEPKVVAPLALALLAFGIVGLINPAYAPWVIALVLGAYWLLRVYPITHVARRTATRLRDAYSTAKTSVISGQLSIFFTATALILFLVGLFYGLDAVGSARVQTSVEGLLLFLGGSLWWFVFGLLCHEGGKVADAYFKRGRIPRSFWIVTVTLIALGFVALAAIETISVLLRIKDPSGVFALVGFEVAIGILIVVAGALIYRATEGATVVEDAWRQ